MALPEIQNNIPVLTSPQQHRSSVTPADIEAPYKQLSLTFKEGADVANDLSKRAAKVAGSRAVTQDENGNLKVERVPVVGDAADVYERAISVAAVAKGDALARRDLIKLRTQFENDPDGYLKAVEAYRTQRVGDYTKQLGPEIAEQLGRVIDRSGTTYYRGLAFKKRRAELQDSKTAIVGQADTYADDLVSLAEGGANQTGEFASRTSDYQALMSEAAQNPLLSFGPEDAQAHAVRTADRVQQAGFIGAVRSAYQDGGSDGARAFLDEASGSLPENRRESLLTRASDTIDTLEMQDTAAAVAAAKEATLARDAKITEGFASLASGGLSQSWIDRYGDQIGEPDRDRLQRGLYAIGGPSTAPAVRDDIVRAAMTDPNAAVQDATDALLSGQMTRADYEKLGAVAMQVATDNAARPWANDIRRDTLLRDPSVFGDVNELLSNPQITRADAMEQSNALIDQSQRASRLRMRATLPIPQYVSAARTQIEPQTLASAQERMLRDAASGAISFTDMLAQDELLSSWGRAVAKEA